MRTKIHSKIYAVLLCLLAMCMTTSVYFTNLMWVLLLANWVVEWKWRDRFADFRHRYMLQAFLVAAGVHLMWLVGTADLTYGLYDLQKKLPLLAIPLVVLTTPAPTRKERINILICYVGTVFVVSIIGIVRYLTLPDLPYRDIIPYISHIRFSLNICLAMVLLTYTALKMRKWWFYLISGGVLLWFTLFLSVLHSYTAFIILYVTAVTLLIAYRRRMGVRLRRALLAVVGIVTLAVGGMTGKYLYDYYHLQPLSAETPPAGTANGNPYLHRKDGLIENGNYVHWYVCEKEMRQEWVKRSDYPFDSLTPNGYTIYPALLRYLNGLGTTKDSLGMTLLQPRDIAAIEKGIANPVYLQRGPRKLFYVMFYEYENYRCYNSVNNFSVLQRLELWKNGWQVFLQHPLLGVGTGDVVAECHQRLDETQSPLAGTDMHTHNQYLNFLIAFGLIGFLLIAAAFVRALLRNRLCRSVLFSAFLCIALISFVSEDTLETLAGIVFVGLGTSLLARIATPNPSNPTSDC